jgi:hypothetical protein
VEATPQPQLDQVLDTEQKEFGNFKLAPIVVPEGEEVGDLIDPNSTSLIARAEDCFDGLQVRKSPSQLPSILTHSEKGIAAGLGVGGTLVSASGQGREDQSFVLEFADVQVAKVSLVQLRESLKRNVPECQEVRPFIDASYTPAIPAPNKPGKKGARGVADISKSIAMQGASIVSDKPPPLLLGMVFTARRVIRIETSRVLDAKAKLSLAQKFIEKLGLGSAFEASAAGNSDATETVVVEAKEAVPVAFAPAFVVKQTRQLANGRSRYEVAVVDAGQIEFAIALAKLRQDESLVAIEQIFTKPAGCDSLNNGSIEGCRPQPARPTIALDQGDWQFKLVQKANSESVTTAPKGAVYRQLLGLQPHLIPAGG